MTKLGTARGPIALLVLLSMSLVGGCRDSSPAGVEQASTATSDGSSSSSIGSTTLSSTVEEDGTSTTNSARVAVDLGHCGVGYIAWDGRVWRVVDSPFQETNADDDPGAATFVGEGTILQIDADHLRYTDDSGVVAQLVPNPNRERPAAEVAQNCRSAWTVRLQSGNMRRVSNTGETYWAEIYGRPPLSLLEPRRRD